MGASVIGAAFLLRVSYVAHMFARKSFFLEKDKAYAKLSKEIHGMEEDAYQRPDCAIDSCCISYKAFVCLSVPKLSFRS